MRFLSHRDKVQAHSAGRPKDLSVGHPGQELMELHKTLIQSLNTSINSGQVEMDRLAIFDSALMCSKK